MADFRLDKWYFDCVSADGVFIGYAARARWGPLHIAYGARIESPDGAATRQRQTLSFGEVSEGADHVGWENRALGVRGTWSGGRRLDEAMLVDGPEGEVRWHCLAANARADLTVDGKRVCGLGYAERLTMTVPPTRLPFSELRWGRYIGEQADDFAVWIGMRGKLNRSWVWTNGLSAVEGRVDDYGIAAGGTEVRIGSSRPLLSGNVARDVLGAFAFAAPLLPPGLRSIDQHKRVGECTFTRPGSSSSGHAVYEVVSFR